MVSGESCILRGEEGSDESWKGVGEKIIRLTMGEMAKPGWDGDQ